MNRLLVLLLAAFDAALVVAVGLAVVLAPVTLLWIFALGGEADWVALWPAGATIWQVGHFVPVTLIFPAEFLVATGLPEEAAQFTFSLAPLALALFTAVFAARSGARAAGAGAWPTGVLSGTATVAALSALIAVTSATPVAAVDLTAAILGPTLVFGVPALLGALVRGWSQGDGGLLDTLSERIPDDIQDGVDAGARGLAVSLSGVIGLGALLLGILFFARGGEIVALTQSSHADLIGVVVLSLGALLYVPTLIVWFAAFVAGPGFAVGAGTAVSPAGTSVGVLPGIPVLGVVPESTSPALLLLALLVVGAGAFAGWMVRGMLHAGDPADEPLRPRLVALVTMVLGSAAGAAALAWAAQGALGPGRLGEMGTAPGAFAAAVGVEIAIGAAVMMFSPRSDSPRPTSTRAEGSSADEADPSFADAARSPHPELRAGEGAKRSRLASVGHWFAFGDTAALSRTSDVSAAAPPRTETADAGAEDRRDSTADEEQTDVLGDLRDGPTADGPDGPHR